MRTLAAAGLIGVLVMAMGLNPSIAPPEPDPMVDLTEEPATAPTPLSRDEERQLRAQVDPNRLRCEPRGCELWRYEYAARADGAAGIVPLDNGLLVMSPGVGTVTRTMNDGEETEHGEPRAHSVEATMIVGLDPLTGEHRWHYPVIGDDPAGSAPMVRVMKGPHGALVLSGSTVISLDDDGAAVWTLHYESEGDDVDLPPWPDDAAIDDAEAPSDEVTLEFELWADDPNHVDVWSAMQHGEVLVLEAWRAGPTMNTTTLIAVDAADGSLLWEQDVRAVVQSPGEIYAQRGHEVTRLAPDTGDAIWQTSVNSSDWLARLGDALLIHDQRARVLDPATGAVTAELDGSVQTSRRMIGTDGTIALLRVDDRPDQHWEDPPSAELSVVYVGADGTVLWSNDLGVHDPAWHCCELRQEDDRAVLTAATEKWEFDLATGELLARSQFDHDSGRTSDWYPDYGWEITPGVEVLWSRNGREMTIRTADGEVTARAHRHVDIVSLDPLVVSDGRHAIGLRLPSSDSPATS